MDVLSWKEVCAQRLVRHSLATARPAGELADVVRTICGAHAQVMSAAEVSIGLRTEKVTQADVRDALWKDRTLVKTFGPRGTVHLLPADELPLWTAALGAVPSSANGLAPNARLSPEQLKQVVAAIAEALDGPELTVDELGERVVAATGAWAADPVVPGFTDMWPRWRPALGPAAHQGVLCFGPNQGRRTTYTNPRRWLPAVKRVSAKAATAEVARRYLFAYGPATPEQFAQWLGAPRPWATKLFESLDLRPVRVDGDDAWLAADDTFDADPAGARGLHLLPYFDPYTVGCHPRTAVFPGPASERALSRGQAGPVPVLLVDGVVTGIWHQRKSGRRIHVQVELLGKKITARQGRQLDEQVARIGEILGATPTLEFGDVTARSHL